MEVYDIYDFSFHNTEDRHGLRPDNDIRFYAFFVPFAAMTLFEKQSQIYGSEFKVQGLVVKAKRNNLKKQSQFSVGQIDASSYEKGNYKNSDDFGCLKTKPINWRSRFHVQSSALWSGKKVCWKNKANFSLGKSAQVLIKKEIMKN